jgi:hypothetical protein
MKKQGLLGLLFFSTAVFVLGQDGPILNKTEELKAPRGMGFGVTKDQAVRSVFLNAKVMRVSTDVNNKRNLGNYVETLIEVTYNFMGNNRTDKVWAIYSNLSKINVKVGDVLKDDTIIGYGGGPGTPIHNDPDNYFYVYTIGGSPFMDTQTKSSYILDGDIVNGIFWWNPAPILGR